MPLEEIGIQGYRGFARRQALRLALPNGQLGSGITVLVGANNTGKTTITEVLQFLQRPGDAPQVTEGMRNASANGQITVEYRSASGKAALNSSPGGSLAWSDWGLGLGPDAVFCVPARRGLEQSFGQSSWTRAHFLQNAPLSPPRTPGRYQAGPRLFGIERDRVAFAAVLERVFPGAPNWYLEANAQGQYYVKVSSASAPHSGDGLGDGFITALLVVDSLYDSKPGSLIVIDEPELSLHPSLQKRLAVVLADYARDRQILIATHSPYFVDWQFVFAGMEVARVHVRDRASCISQLSRDTVSSISSFQGDLFNPHVLGLDAREVFFLEDDVILVEGQEDVLSYREIAKQVSIDIPGNFYGWGVGGASKMEAVTQALLDLGFEHVVGVLDGDQLDLAEKLGKKFGTYWFGTIPLNDVRTKKAVKARDEIVGLLDRDGTIQAEHRTAVEGLLTKIGAYLRQKER